MRRLVARGRSCWPRSAAVPARAADDPLARARLLYNQRQFEAAIERRRAGAR